MMNTKPQRHVNLLPGFMRDPLRISQYSWIGLTLLAGLIADSLGVPQAYLIWGLAISLLPALAGLWMLADKGLGAQIAQAGLVATWTVFAAVSMLATGGGTSPLIVLFVIGPLTAFAVGRDRLALESAVFSVLAFLFALLMTGMGWAGMPGADMQPLIKAGAVAGILQIPVLVWAAIASRRGAESNLDQRARERIIASERALEKAREMRRDAERSVDDCTAFFAGLGHDLKTPLNAILGFSEMMSSEIRGPLPEDYKDYAGLINESGQDLMLLVDDILDLAKAEADGHRLELEPVDLGASGKSVMAQMQAQAIRVDVKLKMRTYGEPWAQADARAIRQIWQNLVSNAVKYSDKGGAVSLSASVRKGMAVLSVKDTGAGMDEADLARIAEPFRQGTNSRGRAGTGLGLAVVKRFADLHKGQVVIDTALGKGTQVQVLLPLADEEDLKPLS